MQRQPVFSVSASMRWVPGHHASPAETLLGRQAPWGAYPITAIPRLKVPRSIDTAKFWLHSQGPLGGLPVERSRSRPDAGLERSLTRHVTRRVSRMEVAAGRFRQDTQVPYAQGTSVVREGSRIDAPFLEPGETGDKGPAVRGLFQTQFE